MQHHLPWSLAATCIARPTANIVNSNAASTDRALHQLLPVSFCRHHFHQLNKRQLLHSLCRDLHNVCLQFRKSSHGGTRVQLASATQIRHLVETMLR